MVREPMAMSARLYTTWEKKKRKEKKKKQIYIYTQNVLVNDEQYLCFLTFIFVLNKPNKKY